MKKIKIYIHHYFNHLLFYKLAHNTTDRIFEIEDFKGKVFCKYKNLDLELIFNPEVNYHKDGFHLLDWFSGLMQRDRDSKFYWEKRTFNDNETLPFLQKCNQIVKDDKNWFICILRTEKVFVHNEIKLWENTPLYIIENEIFNLQNHTILTDTFFLNKIIDSKYPNVFSLLTNTIFQWNEMIGIRWYYEFRNIFKNLNFEYDLMYSVRNHKVKRINLLLELEKHNIPKLLLQRTNVHNQNIETNGIERIVLNDIFGHNDFSDLKNIKWLDAPGIDLFFRVLPKAKMQILDESWSFANGEFTSQYLSEKTIGLILAGIPFISNHSYPLDILQNELQLEKHPFYDETKNANGDVEKFVKFVKTFMENFDKNYLLCKKWSETCLEKLIYKLENENSFLELLLKDIKKPNIIKQNIL